MMRALEFAAIRTFGIGGSRQRMMRSAHIPARLRGFLFGNGHDVKSDD
jgi:hypothetical protein